MDILNIVYGFTVFFLSILAYFIIAKERKAGKYSKPSWSYHFKRLVSRNVVKNYQSSNRHEYNLDEPELPMRLMDENEEDVLLITGSDMKSNSVFIKFTTRLHKYAEISLQIILQDKLYQLPNEPEVLLCSLKKREWKGKDLIITSLEPFRRMRIVYNGFMKCGDEIEHFRINFIWVAASEPLFYPSEIDASLFLDAICSKTWRDGDWSRFLGDRKGLEQFGCLHGEILRETLENPLVVNIPTIRKRYYGSSDRSSTLRDLNFAITTEEGMIINVGARFIKNGCTHVLYSDGQLLCITDCDLFLPHFGEHKLFSEAITVHITTKRSAIKCILHLKPDPLNSFSNEVEGWQSLMTTAECDINTEQGRAVVYAWYKMKGNGKALPKPLLKECHFYCNKYVVALDEEECKILELTGGKGNSLGLLTSIKSKKFAVPEGFVVTVPAFRKQIAHRPKLQQAIQAIKANQNDFEKLASACQEARKSFFKEKMSKAVTKAILSQLEKNKDVENLRWAVRSSAIGEDSDDFSAAGQNQTFLGCKDDQDVLKAVGACWGSLFSYQSVQYRKQKGLPLICDMAVVIQRMVPSDSAGVFFTCHPTNGNPSKMIITSNFGLGESVVSGCSDPDTITLSKTYQGLIDIEKIEIGSKKECIVMDASQGTTIVDNKKATKLSISKEQALELGEVGLELEKSFGNPRDIEWAYHQKRLYLLQSRPVTTLNIWTEYELEHELDTPILSTYDLYTTANIKEVVPGARTCLSCTVVGKFIKECIQIQIKGRINKYTNNILPIISHHAFLNVYNLMLNYPPEKTGTATVASDLSIFGHAVTTEEMILRAKRRHKGNTKNIMWKMIYFAWSIDSLVQKAQKLGKYAIGNRKDMTLLEMYQAIENYTEVCREISLIHTQTSGVSSTYQVISLLILAGKAKEFTPEHYADISLILTSSTDVISAQIPLVLEDIAITITKSGKEKKFIELNPDDGVNWLKCNVTEAYDKFLEFLSIHGHRSFREFELMEPSWIMKPQLLIKMIQANCKAGYTSTDRSKPLSTKDTIAKLKTPASKITLKILEFLVSKSRKAVASREMSKSEAVRSVSKLRIAYRTLAKRMVQEGFLPQADLIFHLTSYELKQVIATRDPVIVSKAVRRGKLYKKWDKYSFPEMVHGLAKPDEEIIITQFSGDSFELKGTPVCSGEIVARCCSIKSLDQIEELKAGDILITHSTDIGWSPYFPMLAGIVTELGGLISHGAVVAREYGLPCLVGVQNATAHFKTGDTVQLSGKGATLKLVKKCDEI